MNKAANNSKNSPRSPGTESDQKKWAGGVFFGCFVFFFISPSLKLSYFTWGNKHSFTCLFSWKVNYSLVEQWDISLTSSLAPVYGNRVTQNLSTAVPCSYRNKQGLHFSAFSCCLQQVLRLELRHYKLKCTVCHWGKKKNALFC